MKTGNYLRLSLIGIVGSVSVLEGVASDPNSGLLIVAGIALLLIYLWLIWTIKPVK